MYAEQEKVWSFSDAYVEFRDIYEKEDVRENDEEITFSKCEGTAYFDFVAVIGVYKKAIDLGIGQRVDLSSFVKNLYMCITIDKLLA